jgi:hypothetical protein
MVSTSPPVSRSIGGSSGTINFYSVAHRRRHFPTSCLAIDAAASGTLVEAIHLVTGGHT